MRVLVNALSVRNLSGRHVLLGHLAKLSEWTHGSHEYVILFHKANNDICRDLGANVKWAECPSYTSRWVGRAWWEQTALSALAEKMGIDFMFSTSGTVVPALRLPQVSYAMNPVPLIDGLDLGTAARAKTVVQRWGFRKAVEKAAMMLFLSEYMRQAYRKNAGMTEKASEIIYTGIDEKVFESAKLAVDKTARKPYQVVSVSVMASHKGIETLIRAVEMVRGLHKVPAELILVGPWSDHAYEKRIRQLVRELNMEGCVSIKGYASRNELNRYYAESRAFCLMSRSESFGIPAVEAQAFGTPVVSSNCCAIPEVCGEGGIYPDSDDIKRTTEALATLLTDEIAWRELSVAARKNAERYHWEICSRPLLRIFDVISSGSPVLKAAAVNQNDAN